MFCFLPTHLSYRAFVSPPAGTYLNLASVRPCQKSWRKQNVFFSWMLTNSLTDLLALHEQWHPSIKPVLTLPQYSDFSVCSPILHVMIPSVGLPSTMWVPPCRNKPEWSKLSVHGGLSYRMSLGCNWIEQMLDGSYRKTLRSALRLL